MGDMLRDICFYSNLYFETVYNDESESEYKWQWYQNDRRIKEFEDYPIEISDKIEAAYLKKQPTFSFEVYSYKSMDKRYVGKDCKGKHGLKECVADSLRFECDGCSKSNFPLGTVLFGCRTCNYDLCKSCYSLTDTEIYA